MAKALWFCDDERRYINELLQHLSHLGVDAALGLTPAELKWGFATVGGRMHAPALQPVAPSAAAGLG
jgi:hypothetical protein